jgi:hypothetical protein
LFLPPGRASALSAVETWFTYRLDHVADHFVVKIFHGSPLDALPLVFLLLALQGQLDKHLLQLLVTQIDTKLLKENQNLDRERQKRISSKKNVRDKEIGAAVQNSLKYFDKKFTSKLLLSKISNP